MEINMLMCLLYRKMVSEPNFAQLQLNILTGLIFNPDCSYASFCSDFMFTYLKKITYLSRLGY